jgi:hypothetical protein
MTQRLTIHQPTYVEEPDAKSVDTQRVYDLLLAQEGASQIFDEIADKPHLDSFLLEGLTLLAGVTKSIPHTLGRVIRGYIIGKQDAATVILNDTSVSVDPSKFIALKANDDVTFDIIVY